MKVLDHIIFTIPWSLSADFFFFILEEIIHTIDKKGV